jgi:PTS system mannose-specific IIA component/PTS system mannose-specific IIB component
VADIPIVVVGHGGFADGLRDAAEMIVGPQERLATVSLQPEDSPESVGERLRRALADLGSERGAVVLADLFGGSPANGALAAAANDDSLHLVTGVNLPMLLEVLTSAGPDAASLAATALTAGTEGVIDASAKLRAARDGG